jgi:hypothetical protein
MLRTMTTMFLTMWLACVPSGAQTQHPAGEPCAPQTPAPTVGVDPTTALQLLDRIQTVLDEAVKGEPPTSVAPVRTSGTKSVKAAEGQIRIDRGLVDEIRAEVGQIRTLLKK